MANFRLLPGVGGNGSRSPPGSKSPSSQARSRTSPSKSNTKFVSRHGDGDAAGGRARSITLATGGPLEAFCCCIPGILLFGMVFILFLAAIFSHAAFYAITAVLSVVTLSWSANLSLSIVVGTWKMRRACGVDWHARLQELEKTLPEGEANSSHIVILPNYKENEDMLLETLENLGRSPLARSSLRVVLAMEEREGPEGHEKAERLVAKAEHLFAGIIAAFHPSGLPGELAGKSSNTQWAFQEALRVFTPVLERYDPSKVFITVGDADTLWHAQFLSAVTYQALEMPHEERAWSIWQPPIMLLRNLFSVPALTRVSCYGTIMFELAGVTNQLFGSHMSYSAYTMTLAMATHRLVGGWDKDVIAEDHHMFCKCYCAAIWALIDFLMKA